MKKVKSPDHQADVLTDIFIDIKINNRQINLMFFVLCIKHVLDIFAIRLDYLINFMKFLYL